MEHGQSSARTRKPPPSTARLITASVTGTLVETYDIILTALVAALVFNQVFFPDIASWIGTLAALGAAATAYVTRPLGAVVFGLLGDRYGRIISLRISIVSMGIATVTIGLLPSAAVIGVWAPILLVLVRMLQGVALGGEFGGAVLVAMENAPANRRFFYSTFANAGATGGVGVATIVVLVCTSAMGMDTFRDWGWRIPFIASAILIVIGYIARQIEESDEFVQAKEEKKAKKAVKLPIVKQIILVLAGLCMITPTVAMTYSLSTGILPIVRAGALPGITLTTFQLAMVLHTFLAIPVSMYGGYLASRYKPESILKVGAGLTIVTAVPTIWCFESGSIALLMVGVLITVPGHGLLSGPATAYVAAALPIQLRYLGIGMAYAGASMIGGGLLPIVALWIAGENYSTLTPFAYILLGCGFLALFATYFTKRAQESVARAAGLRFGEPETADAAVLTTESTTLR
ncbi:hypothetical protein CH300_16900 [Rhodococcus sp. 15-1154-1]|nr:MFS transporter [Rhodococcus sp. 15-1154-1]OZF02517.1 hypothetical protein CH300_16900 [Rhodococcus sp. 15-1154-1]